MDRRIAILSMAAALGLAGRARANSEKRVPAGDGIPFLKIYLEVPQSERQHSTVVYFAMRNRHPAPDIKAWIEDSAGRRTPLTLDRDGMVTNLPSLAEIKNGAMLVVDESGGKVGFFLQIRADVPVSGPIEVARLRESLDEVNRAISKRAGLLAFAAPKMNGCLFVGASSGRVMGPDGASTTLPNAGPTPYFAQDLAPTGGLVYLDRAPTAILIGSFRRPARSPGAHGPRG